MTAPARARPLGPRFFGRPADVVAPELIGCTLTIDGVGGVVVECEAYRRNDPASHSYPGPTARNAAMFGPSAHAYVYRSYGIHWMLNLVCGSSGEGDAVLVRALEPTRGLEVMRSRRGVTDVRLLACGPGRLGQALGVGPDLDGERVGAGRLAVVDRGLRADVVCGPRIGITRATEQPWRFALAGNVYVSRPWPWAGAATASRG